MPRGKQGAVGLRFAKPTYVIAEFILALSRERDPQGRKTFRPCNLRACPPS